jgi:hypothetical protein
MQMRFAAATGLDIPIPTVASTTSDTSTTTRVLDDETPLSESPVQTPALVYDMPGALPVTPAPLSQHTLTPTPLPKEVPTPLPLSTHPSTYPSTNLTPKFTLSRGGTPKSSSLSFRSRDKPSPGTTPSARPRGMTFPNGPRVQKSSSQQTLHAETRPRLHTPGSSVESLGSRGKGREREGDGEGEEDDADSVMSFTPSMSGKIVASWFSGLLGRTSS